MRGPVVLACVVAAFVSPGLVACGSSEPEACHGAGSYSGADTCAKLKAAIEAKCSGRAVFDCEKYLAGTSCTPSRKFCREGVDRGVANVNGSADCSAALRVSLGSYCFD
jgi:hypothetical protein